MRGHVYAHHKEPLKFYTGYLYNPLNREVHNIKKMKMDRSYFETHRRWDIKRTHWRRPLGKRNIGRPTRRWADDIVEIVGQNWITLAEERGLWKKKEPFTQAGIHIPEK
ncbi:hypothetical protein EVAR_10121_1 [Eumeta japonica]|uniref:Uncharacterized protein n=1 Tax=Eumeta variegata TaxID=151549 RepID=A0A4C1UD15_EUMVA|nr:hypothetical protein EVAR_10121_1 [Eumeta japonica]